MTATPLLVLAEYEGRDWREMLDDPALHPRLVVRPPAGLLRVWHKETSEGPPDQLLDLSKLHCTARAADFWHKKAVAGNLWSVMFNITLQRDRHTPHTDNTLLPVDFWSLVPKDCQTVRVSLATLEDSDGEPYCLRFTPKHLWVLPQAETSGQPHACFSEVRRSQGVKRGAAWKELRQTAMKSKGGTAVELPGFGLIYLKLDRNSRDAVRHKLTPFLDSKDGNEITKTAFDSAWRRAPKPQKMP